MIAPTTDSPAAVIISAAGDAMSSVSRMRAVAMMGAVPPNTAMEMLWPIDNPACRTGSQSRCDDSGRELAHSFACMKTLPSGTLIGFMTAA